MVAEFDAELDVELDVERGVELGGELGVVAVAEWVGPPLRFNAHQ